MTVVVVAVEEEENVVRSSVSATFSVHPEEVLYAIEF